MANAKKREEYRREEKKKEVKKDPQTYIEWRRLKDDGWIPSIKIQAISRRQASQAFGCNNPRKDHYGNSAARLEGVTPK